MKSKGDETMKLKSRSQPFNATATQTKVEPAHVTGAETTSQKPRASLRVRLNSRDEKISSRAAFEVFERVDTL